MNVARDVVRAILPTKARQFIRKASWAVSLRWPLKNELGRELTALERSKSEMNLAPLQDFPELKESAWRGLASLGYEIIRHYRPAVVVELGTYVGQSALAMGLALRNVGEGGRIYAVDTWLGDEQNGYYAGQVYQVFLDRVSKLGLDSVIVPLRMTFDEARQNVPRAIDLLHIDGLHTWEAVTHDWETYVPLVRPGGLVMFHDVNTWYPDMRRFWRSMAKRYEGYLIPYSHGLGVIRV
jgi:predicted O-methyltransferase YrrM